MSHDIRVEGDEIEIFSNYQMAKTRSRGPISPRTPLSDKTKKIKVKTKNEPSPSVSKVKSGKVGKKKPLTPQKLSKASTKASSVKPESDEIVTSKVAEGAIKELKKYVEKEQKSTKLELFDEEDDNNVYLQITTKKFYSDKPNFKPKIIKLRHSFFNSDNTNDFKICLIIRDQLIVNSDQVDAIENERIPNLSKILTLKDIKTEFKPFEKRRQLYNEYNMFLVDEALLNSLPSALGKVFYNNGNSRIPLPIKVVSSSHPKKFSIETFKNQVEKCLMSTAFLPPIGVNILIKFGIINKSLISDLIDNLQDVVRTFDKHSLRSVMLKTLDSPSLPLFYNDKVYDESDILEETKTPKVRKNDLSSFEKGLLEIASVDEVSKIVGKKLSKKLKHQAN